MCAAIFTWKPLGTMDDVVAVNVLCDPGIKEFVDLAMEFAYGKDSPALKEKRVAAAQVRMNRQL